MDTEYWKSSPFGENSIFHPSWEEKEKERRNNLTEQRHNTFRSIDKANNIALLFDNKTLSKNKIADGYYYLKDGTFLGNYGNSNLITICSKEEMKDEKRLFHILSETDILYDDLIAVAGTAIGESSYGYQVENKFEVYALANTIMNYYHIENESKGTIKDNLIKMKAYAYINQNRIYKDFKNQTDIQRNDSFFKEAIFAALNAMCAKFCIDYSRGATYWDGIDIKANGKWKEGLKFQYESADIFSIGNNKKHTAIKYKDQKCYERIFDYKWIGLCGFYDFNSNRENPYYPYFKEDTINKNKFGTVFMKLSDDYKNRIKYGERTVD